MKRHGDALLAAFVIAATACGDSPASIDRPTTLLAVSPPGGAVGIEVGTQVVVTFSHGMATGMEMYVALHEGEGVAGATVDGARKWSADRTRLTFTPASALYSNTTYTLHLGGGMTDMDGHAIDMHTHAHDFNGAWVTQTMMDERTMGGMGGMMGDMTGAGWRHENGSYGMMFTFTTG